MLTKTSLSAIRALTYLGSSGELLLPPKHIAKVLGESPSYLAKILGQLVKAGLLRAVKGVKGGVQLSRLPAQISLLSIVQTCQGVIVGNYCEGAFDLRMTCAYHRAMVELQSAIVAVLSHWNLQQLIEQPRPVRALPGHLVCMLEWTGRQKRPSGGRAQKVRK